MEKIEEQLEFLLTAALRKCGNLQDAEDLVQETMLAALLYEAKGKHIDKIRPWLAAVMNRKYCDMLRRRYRRPFVSMGEDFDVACEFPFPDDFGMMDEAERTRGEIAFLAATYREVMVRHYMKGQSVADIAAALGIPEGTVKSRLSVGRSHVKKGIDNMEYYERQSYKPVRLSVSNSGCSGVNGEPYSLVEEDLIAQNLLYLAYEKPVSEAGLARAIGIPMAYVEPVIQKLVKGELMRRTGDRLYTDFIIYTEEDKERYIPAQKDFVEEHFHKIWKPYEEFRNRLQESDYYQQLSDKKKNALEWFCFFNIFDHGSYQAFSDAFEAEQIFPYRPDGGNWIAFGHVMEEDFDQDRNTKAHKYSYGGQNNLWLDNYLGTRRIRMSLYYPEGFPMRLFYKTENGISEDDLIKLLYIIESGMEIRDSGFDEHKLKCIPWLVECNILHYDGSRPALNIPALFNKDTEKLDFLLSDAQLKLAEILKGPLREFLKGKKKQIPAHLKSVPLQKQYMYSDHAMLMITLRLALQKGLICDESYDKEVQLPCPMILVIDK
ncbi:MAG: RNA polymerase sigma factor [Acetatifactor sp.]|nr:RNA polymerase sigma factor [Acetatifactor sp.]